MKYLDSTGLAYFWQKVKSAMEERLAAMPSDSGVPAGTIVIWSGETGAIPDGWALCNGENGTPDLQGRFVLGGSDSHALGSTGGSEEVTLTAEQMPKHVHKILVTENDYTGSGVSVLSCGKTTNAYTLTNSANEGKDKPHPNMPPYYVLCYIMKL